MINIKLAVILPAYNEELVIAKTVQSILDAGMSANKIYVINDASKDKTSKIAAEFNINVVTNTGITEKRRQERRADAFRSVGRRKKEINLGKANGVTNILSKILADKSQDITHICFMDADTLVDVEYFNSIYRRLHNDEILCNQTGKRKIDILCGKVKSIPHNWLTSFRAYELWMSHAIHKVAQSTINSVTVAPGCASTYSIKALKDVIWSDDTSTEDMDATVQVALSGGVIKYEASAVVYTQDPNTIKDYFGQIQKRWYPGTWQVMGKHKILLHGLFSLFHWECRMMMLEPVFFVGIILYTLFSNPINLIQFLGLSYLIVIPLAFIAAIHEKRFDILKYSLIFPIILIINLFTFVWNIGNIFKRSKKTLKWYSPERYVLVK